MTRNCFIEGIMIYQASFQSVKPKEATRKQWYELLKHLPDDKYLQAVNNVCAEVSDIYPTTNFAGLVLAQLTDNGNTGEDEKRWAAKKQRGDTIEKYRDGLRRKNPELNARFKKRVIDPLKAEMYLPTWETFIEPLVVVSNDNGQMVLFHDTAEWISEHFKADIEAMTKKPVTITSEGFRSMLFDVVQEGIE